jgi:hypothetical protein
MTTIAQRLAYLKSRTIRYLGVYALAAWAALPELVATGREYLPELQDYIPADAYRWLSLALIFGAVYLRIKTTKPLADYSGKESQ